MEISFLLYLLVGKLLIYLGMKFPPLSESRFEFVKRLWECSECSGVWVYTFLSFVMGEVLFREIFYFPFVSELITGGISSFLVHLISIGWREKFLVVVV
jgi:hypothetical protein